MTEFVQECRREWRRLGVPDPIASEMAADLTADLEEARAEGGSPEDVLGNNAFDPRRFAAAWAEVNTYVDAASEPSPVCQACDARAFCGRCPAWSLIETGTTAAPVSYWCEIAQARKSRYSATALTASAANPP